MTCTAWQSWQVNHQRIDVAISKAELLKELLPDLNALFGLDDLHYEVAELPNGKWGVMEIRGTNNVKVRMLTTVDDEATAIGFIKLLRED